MNKLKLPELIRHRGKTPAEPSSGPIASVPKAGPALTTPPRRRNVAAMLAGGALVLIAGSVAWSVASSFDDTIDVLVADRALVEGEPFAPNSVRVVQIAAAAGDIEVMHASAAGDLIGLITAGPIGEGSLVHPDDFVTDRETVTVVVGALLEPDQYPAKGLRRGDTVRLIEISDGGFAGPDGFVAGRDLAVAEVVDVVPLGDKSLHFSFRVGESVANVVADRVAQNRVTVGLLDVGVSVQQVDPLAPAEPVTPLTILGTEAGS